MMCSIFKISKISVKPSKNVEFNHPNQNQNQNQILIIVIIILFLFFFNFHFVHPFYAFFYLFLFKFFYSSSINIYFLKQPLFLIKIHNYSDYSDYSELTHYQNYQAKTFLLFPWKQSFLFRAICLKVRSFFLFINSF